MIYFVSGQEVVVARDDEVRDSLTKMMTTKADSGMSGIFHNLGGGSSNFSLRTIAFLLVSSIAILIVVSVTIGLICKVQVSAVQFFIGIPSAAAADVVSSTSLSMFLGEVMA